MDIFLGLINPILALFAFINENIAYFYAIGFFISFYFLFSIIYYILKTNYLGDEIDSFMDTLRAKDVVRRRTLRAWKKIKERLKTRDEAQAKLALVEADRLLNDIFVMAGYPGNTLQERLELMDPAQLINYREVVEAHRLAERAMKDPKFSLQPNEAEVAVAIYKQAFKELGLIREI